jgi:anti-sigma factor RsiW
MKCPIETQDSAELLLAYCSRKLDPASTAMLEDHIGICPACRQFAEAQKTVWQALDKWEAEPVSAHFDRRLYRRIEQEQSWWDRLAWPLRPILFRQGLPVTAAAALVIVAGVLLQRPAGMPLALQESVQVEDQAEQALKEMEMVHEFSAAVRTEPAGPRM